MAVNTEIRMSSLEEFTPDRDLWEKQERQSVMQEAIAAKRDAAEKGYYVDADGLAAEALASAAVLRRSVRQSLEAEQPVDVLETVKQYHNITSLRRRPSGSTVANTQVTLSNAVAFPETFTTLESYDNQRSSLADTLARIGLLGGDNVEADPVLVMSQGFPEDHISPEGTARVTETFRVVAAVSQ